MFPVSWRTAPPLGGRPWGRACEAGSRQGGARQGLWMVEGEDRGPLCPAPAGEEAGEGLLSFTCDDVRV